MARARARYTLEAEDRTDRGLRSAEGRLRGFTRTITGVLTRALAGVTAAIAGWGAAIASATGRLDELAKRARDVRTTLEEADAITLFAELQGASAAQVFQAIDRFQAFLGRVVQGSKEARQQLDDLNLSLSDFEGRTPFAQLLRFGIGLEGADPRIATRARREAVGEGTGRLFGGDFLGAARRTGDLDLSRNIAELAANAEQLSDLWTEIAALTGRRLDELTLGGARGDVTLEAARLLRDIVASPLDFGRALGVGPEVSGGQTLRGARLERELQRLTEELQLQRAQRSGTGSVFDL